MQLTAHFTLEEFISSDTAARYGLDNTPPEALIPNIIETAHLVEEVRLKLGYPVIITSGYRSPQVNAMIHGSASTSAHTRGEAADCKAPGFGDPYSCCLAIRNAGIVFDQLILEYDSWFHIARVKNGVNRQQIFTKREGTNYMEGLVKKQ